jgi:hypothetical protein
MFDTIRTNLRNWLMAGTADMPQAERERIEHYSELLAYQRGAQRRQIKSKPGQADDNLIVNWCGLVVERGISMLFGGGITFDLPGEGAETAEDTLIGEVMAANKLPILLHRTAQFGGTLGTCYVKILPESAGPDRKLPKLVALNPGFMKIETVPDDMDEPVCYTQTYKVGEVAHKIVTERNRAVALREDGTVYETGEYADAWTETHYIANRESGGKWVQVSVDDWPFPFAPIVHWQNLPDAFQPYGQSDLADILPIQDRYNFNASNISKIVRYHAHPKTWVRGKIGGKTMSWGSDELIQIEGGGSTAGEAASIQNLEMASDLASSREFGKDLREALFTVTRTTDPATIKDTIGALTNFGLRVLFKDELAKIKTKRELYGDGLLEVVRRVLVLAGAANTEPGEILWPDPLPTNEVEQVEALAKDVELGLVSKQTAAGLRDYDWEQEQARMKEEQEAAQDVGANVLKAFGQGGGASLFPPGQGQGQAEQV